MSDDDQRTVVVAMSPVMVRTLFHDLNSYRDLPHSLITFYRWAAQQVEDLDLGTGTEYPEVMPARYLHPDDQKLHYINHTIKDIACVCHPNDRAQCDVCQSYDLMLAFDGDRDTESLAAQTKRSPKWKFLNQLARHKAR